LKKHKKLKKKAQRAFPPAMAKSKSAMPPYSHTAKERRVEYNFSGGKRRRTSKTTKKLEEEKIRCRVTIKKPVRNRT